MRRIRRRHSWRYMEVEAQMVVPSWVKAGGCGFEAHLSPNIYILIIIVMGTLERLLTGTIASCWICIVGFIVCRWYQIKMDKNVIGCLEDNLKAWKDYEKTSKSNTKTIVESYGNIRETYRALIEAISNLESMVTRNHKKSLHIIEKLNGNNNCRKEQSMRDSVQWVEADRPRRKYVRRNNASKNS